VPQPEYVICTECDSPVYEFEWRDSRVAEIVCQVCGNEDPDSFLTEEEIDSLGEEMSARDWWHSPRREPTHD
jgi:translation initiation factor 2 beta subunit (eIF-2beta)/eIF-5